MKTYIKMDPVKFGIETILYPLMEKRRGNRTRKRMAELAVTETLSREAILLLQREKLSRLLLHCAEKVPAYHSLQMQRECISKNPEEVLRTLPVLTKSLFMGQVESCLTEGVDKESLIANRSGGSTSEPVSFYMDRFTVEHYEAARFRGLSWYGITPGSRCVMIWGNPLEMDKHRLRSYRMKERWMKNRIAFPAYGLQPEAMPGYVKTINRYRPEYLYGYASALHAFAALMEKQQLHLTFVPKAVVSTSETLHPFQREQITKVFGCPVVNEYGARDGGMIAYECPQGGMHLCAENLWLELVDEKTGEPVPEGATGVVLVTDLNNFVQPRLRYRVGDRATHTTKPCACGRSLPLLGGIDGREDDMFLRCDGQFVHGHAFNHVARTMGTLEKFQMVQKAPERAVLKMVPKPGTTQNEMDRFVQEVSALLPGTAVEVQVVEDIPPTASGKYRYAIRAFPLP